MLYLASTHCDLMIISQIPQCLRHISHTAPSWCKNVHRRACLLKMVHCGPWHWCIVGLVRLVIGHWFQTVIFHGIFAKHWCGLFQIQIEEPEDTLPDGSQPEGYRLMNLECLGAALAAASLCARCRVGHLQIQEGGRAGWASELILSCSSCTHTYPFWTSPKAQSSGSTYGPNPREINQ